MTIHFGKLALASISLSIALTMTGCATTSSTQAKSLKTTSTEANSLVNCKNLTVAAFGVPNDGKVDASIGVSFAQDIEQRLSTDFGPIFDSVAFANTARGMDSECLLKGNILKYKPGSKVARFILIGLGAASLEGNVTVQDSASGNALMSAPFDKLWAWGGIAGASKGIEDMVKESEASVAATIAHAKGWNPPPPATK